MKIGPYEVLGELGRGGMGVVYRVRAPDGREVALKVLLKADAATLARFDRERRLLASLGEKEGFVPLLDAGVSTNERGVERAQAWLVMPFAPGGTLRERLAKGALGVEETLALGLRLAEALGEAHERGIVHRDVKPENVLFTRDGRPLLADLGLAKHFDRTAPGASQSASLSRSGAFTGTAGYMAAEQIEDAASVGPPADVFALGAVLYECLAGRPPFEGVTVIEIVAGVCSGTVEPIGDSRVPPWLEAVVFRALSRDPRERFAHGRSLAMALRGVKRAPRGLVPSLVLGGSLGALTLLAGIAALVHGSEGRSAVLRPAPAAPSRSAAELVALAQEKESARDWEGEIALATKAIELEPGRAAAWACRGLARGHRGDMDGAISDLDRAIELDPKLASARANRANARGRKGDWDGVIDDSTRAIDLDPTLATAWGYRGNARGQKGDWEGQLDDSTRAIELDPTLAWAWGNRGTARGHRGDRDGQIDDSTRAIDLDPKLASAWANRGQARGQKGDWDGQIADATRAIELDPKLAVAWGNRAEARGHKGDLEGELDDSTRAIALDPELAWAWGNRGHARGQKGDWDGQIDDSTRAIELDPKLAFAWGNRGTARAQKGDREGAISDLERLLELSPGDPQAPVIRRQLDELKAKRPR